jgi:HlyD family secretion protein
MRKKILLTTAAVVVLVVVAVLLFGGSSSNEKIGTPTVTVTRGSIVEKALAVGTIEPEREISVKSKVSGVVKTIFADAGAFVRAGDPLLEVRPDPTPLELAEATRQVQMRKVEMENLARDLSRQEAMVAKGLISEQEYEGFVARYQEVQLQHKLASWAG